ncbi:MAG: hypothetical protein CVV49_04195 [Spirochaetae bacterium HGW-Spirochaetae-5]|nr:MAG: hypothetical protein CVV49_04195 [Spirochaetae bacterium HGW-Spirochaetae-5]
MLENIFLHIINISIFKCVFDLFATFPVIIQILILCLIMVTGCIIYIFFLSHVDWSVINSLIIWIIVALAMFLIILFILLFTYMIYFSNSEKPFGFQSISKVHSFIMFIAGFIITVSSRILQEKIFKNDDPMSFFAWLPFIICIIGIILLFIGLSSV